MPETKLPILAFAFLAAACSGGDNEVGPYRHVLLISLDTLRADHLGSYGARRPTPSMDWLASEGLRFSDVTAPAPTTLVSHTSMMTGTWPHTHGVVRNGYVLSDENVTLAEVLRDAGFHTAAVLGSFALEHRFGLDQGFDFYEDSFQVKGSVVLGKPDGNDQDQKTAENVTRVALEHLDSVGDSADRVFLFVHYFDPHANYAPPDRFARAMTGDAAATSDLRHVDRAVRTHQAAILGGAPEEQPGHRGLFLKGFHGATMELLNTPSGAPTELDALLADLYAGEVAYVDEAIGRLLDGLRQRGMLEETLVILTGDHGETFTEHGDTWNHGLWVYQTTVAVPLVIRAPDGRWAGVVRDEPVSTVDLLPTLCDLLEIDPPGRSEGRSLIPLIEDRTVPARPVFSQATQPHRVGSEQDVWRNATKPTCVRSGKWKYVRSRYNDHEQLFDLGQDPGEQVNLLAASLSAEAQEALDLMREQLDSWEGSANPLPSKYDETRVEETRRMLEEMGYGGDD